MRKLYKNRLRHLPFLLPSFLGVLVFVLIPFGDAVRRSFCTTVTGEFVGVQNYATILKNDAFALAVKNTVAFVAVCLPILIVVSFCVAWVFSKMRWMVIFKSSLLFPFAVPTATLVFIWQILFQDNGYLNHIICTLGGTKIQFLNSTAAFWILVGSYIWKNLGYTVLLWLAGISAVSTSLTDAAKVDGASGFQCLVYIILPNLKPTFYTITIISFLNTFKVFREAYLVAGSYPHESIYLLQHLFNNWFVNLELDKVAAAAVCVFTVIFIAVVLLQKVWDKEESM